MKSKLFFLILFASPLLFASPTGQKKADFKIAILGDSLTDGYGLKKDQAYPALVEKKFHENKMTHVKVTNAGISGSTSSSAKQRLNWILKTQPNLLVIALGANDGLRGLPNESLYNNLSQAIEEAQKNKVKVVLFGMKLPANYGPDHRKAFEMVFQRLAKTYKIDLLDFLLEGVATNKALNLEDGIHPNTKGHEVIAKNVYQFLRKHIN